MTYAFIAVGFFFAGFVLGAHAWRSKYYELRNDAIALRNAALALSQRAQRFSSVPDCVLQEWSVKS